MLSIRNKESTMPRYQMPLLILYVLLISCSSNIVKAAVAAQSVDLFKTGGTKATVDGADYPTAGQDPSFSPYSLLDANGNMVALAFGVYGADSNDLNYDLWAKSSKYENNKISDVIGGQWDTQVVVKKNDPNPLRIWYPTQAVVKGGKIFSLLKTASSKASIAEERKLFVGEVKGGRSITWNASNSLQAFLDEEGKKNSWSEIDVSGGRGIVMGGKTIVFKLRAWSTSKGKYICTVIFSEDDGNTWNFPSSPVISEVCGSSYLLEWEGSLLMVRTDPPPQKMYESKDMGKTWTEAHGKLSHLLDDTIGVPALSNIQDLVTATIEGKNVILFTSVGGDVDRKELQLWFADSSRIHYAGPISTDAIYFFSLGTLLYAQDELFAMYEKGKQESRTVVLAHLPNQLDQIKSVLKTWKDVEKRISPPSVRNGLVGFLSGKGDTATWEDEFLGVGAKVKGSATKVDYGLKLALPGTQVEWPIGEQGDNQVYSFTDRGFTVVATVTIHNKPQGVTRLMGVDMSVSTSGQGGYTGLSYDKDNQWKGVTVNGGSGLPNTWEEGETYQVALVFHDATGSAYIGGKLLGSLEDPVVRSVPSANGAQDSHSEGSGQKPPQPSQGRAGRPLTSRAMLRVSIGEEKGGKQEKEGSQVTVRNVMLYNRALNTAELEMPISINTNSDKIGDAKTNSGKIGDAKTNSDKIGDALKAMKGDSSMYQRISCMLLVFMGILGFVSLF